MRCGSLFQASGAGRLQLSTGRDHRHQRRAGRPGGRWCSWGCARLQRRRGPPGGSAFSLHTTRCTYTLALRLLAFPVALSSFLPVSSGGV